MKDAVKRILCLALALSAVFALAACKEEEKPTEPEETTQQTETQVETTEAVDESTALVGKWVANVDLSDYFSDRVYENVGIDVVFEPCMVEVKVTFEEDGTYKTKLKPDFAKVFLNVEQSFKDEIFAMTAAESNMTEAQYERALKAEGVSKEESYEMFADVLESVFYEEVKYCEDEMKGKWVYEDGQLYLHKSKPEKADPVVIVLEAEKFTVKEFTDDDYEEYDDYFLPIVFERD